MEKLRSVVEQFGLTIDVEVRESSPGPALALTPPHPRPRIHTRPAGTHRGDRPRQVGLRRVQRVQDDDVKKKFSVG